KVGMDFVHEMERLGSVGKAGLDALGVVTSPITGAIHGTAGSALSYIWPGDTPKRSADEALDVAMMAARPGRAGVTPSGVRPAEAPMGPGPTPAQREVARRIHEQ